MLRFRTLLPTLGLILTIGSALVPAAPASTRQDAIFQDDGQLHANPLGTLQTLRSLGVNRIRVGIYWGAIAPNGTSRRRPSHFNASDPAAYRGHWSIYDEIVKDAKAEGISVYFVIVGPTPLWATGSGVPRGGLTAPWKPSAQEFGSFVTALGKRYSGTYHGLPKVSFFSIWNEPNYGIDLAPEATSHDSVEVAASRYRSMVDSAWSALHRTGHAHDAFLIGETAPHGVDHPIGNYNVMRPLRFLRALYCVDAGFRQLRGSAAAARGCPTTSGGSRRFRAQHPGLFGATGYAAHLYAQHTPPNRSLQANRDNADLAEVGQLERTLDHLQGAYGSGNHLPIWNTEYGYQTNPPEKGALSPTTAAYYMNWAEYLSWRQPRIRSFMQYELVDPPGGNFASGLLFKTGTAKQPVLNAYRMPLYLPRTTGKPRQSLEVWGDVRPARYAPPGQQVAIQFQANSRGGWGTVRQVAITNGQGYFDVRQSFPGSGSVRLAWAQPGTGVILSRTVTIKLR
ncbi:MAG: polysaccharide biosynthesis protein PslG [Solirubrobacteraceae bacterium]|jgi:hypothetical protein|nr:polysaccharide biosynthesis protein PslG [Solirubrobacteraceae bacterium]